MNQAAPRGQPPLTALHVPLELRAFAGLNVPDWILGLLITVLLFGLALGSYSISGVALLPGDAVTGYRISPQAHVALLLAVLLGYGLSAARHLHRLQARVDSGLESAWPSGTSWRSVAAGLLGLGLATAVIVLTVRELRLQEPLRNPLSIGELWVDLMSLLLFWGLGRGAYFTLRGAGAAARDRAPIDLYDLSPLYRYGQYGLATALAWTGGISLVVLIMVFDPNPGLQIEAQKILAPALVGSALTGSLALFLPLWRLKQRIASTKEAAISGVQEELRALRLRASMVPGVEADLLARRAYFAGLSEWPIDVTTLRRFGFYLLFPAVSWFFGTVAQRLLDTVFFERLVRIAIGALA